jgi:hypothetical protein
VFELTHYFAIASSVRHQNPAILSIISLQYR